MARVYDFLKLTPPSAFRRRKPHGAAPCWTPAQRASQKATRNRKGRRRRSRDLAALVDEPSTQP